MGIPVIISFCLLMLATPAMAIWEWCEMDPEMIIDGHTVTMQALVGGEAAEIENDIQGNTWFRVYVAKDVEASLVSTEDRVKVKIFEDKTRGTDSAEAFDVTLTVNTHGTYPLCLKVSIDGQIVSETFGNTSNGISAQFILP